MPSNPLVAGVQRRGARLDRDRAAAVEGPADAPREGDAVARDDEGRADPGQRAVGEGDNQRAGEP